MSRQLLLNHEEIALKLDRIAWQILEEHYGESHIVIIGIQDRGSIIASMIADRLNSFSDDSIHLTSIHIDKDAPFTGSIELEQDNLIKGKCVVLVDDVLNSGATMAAAVREILNHNPKELRVAVLANRDHHKFPIQCHFVGVSMATTLKEHITFEIVNDRMAVYLD